MDCEIHPDADKDEQGNRAIENGTRPTTLMHVFYGAVDVGGKTYSVRTLVKEQKGSGKNKAYVYSLEEIELSDGHTGAVVGEPLRKSESSIPVAKLIEKVLLQFS